MTGILSALLRGGLLLAMTIAMCASSPATAAGPGGTLYISKVQVEEGIIYVYANNIQNPDSCQNVERFVIGTTVPRQEYFMSVVLTAQATGRPIDVYFSGCVLTHWGFTAPTAVSATLG